MKKSSNASNSIKCIITGSRFLITILIVMAMIILPIAYHFIFNASLINTSAFLQIVTNIFLVSGVVVAVWQYYISSSAARNNAKTVQIQKAIDLSLYYKNNIISLAQPIRYVYDATHLTDVVRELNKNEMVNFDMDELKTIATDANIDKTEQIKQQDIFAKAVMEANNIYSLGLNVENYITQKDTDSKNRTITISVNGVVEYFMRHIVLEEMNDLEYFAMNFTHKTADESVVFSSLHQTYIEMMQLLYFDISPINLVV